MVNRVYELITDLIVETEALREGFATHNVQYLNLQTQVNELEDSVNMLEESMQEIQRAFILMHQRVEKTEQVVKKMSGVISQIVGINKEHQQHMDQITNSLYALRDHFKVLETDTDARLRRLEARVFGSPDDSDANAA